LLSALRGFLISLRSLEQDVSFRKRMVDHCISHPVFGRQRRGNSRLELEDDMSVFITREMVRQAGREWRHDNTIGILGRMVRSVRRNLERRAAISELRSFSDRELRDIGINRGDITRIVRQGDDRDPDPTPTSRRVQARAVAVAA
jgi:uncharacterized protein YjiS (DUF1127 family)